MNDEPSPMSSLAPAPPATSRQRQRLNHAEIHKIIKSHRLFLKGRSGGSRALLAFADLTDLAMAGCDLS